MSVVVVLVLFIRHVRTHDVKIKGGRSARDHEFPWSVSLQDGNSHFCSGSVLTRYNILSACHCALATYGTLRPLEGVHAVAGWNSMATHDPHFNGQVRNLTKTQTHPFCRFNKTVFEYDFGLFWTDEPFEMNERLKQATLPWNAQTDGSKQLRDLVKAKAACTAVGWGTTVLMPNHTYASTTWDLRAVDLKLMNFEDCLKRLCLFNNSFCNVCWLCGVTSFREFGEFDIEKALDSYNEIIGRYDIKIVGGRSAKEKEFPWAISLEFKDQTHFCGGSLLSVSTVFTACHCIFSNKTDPEDDEEFIHPLEGGHAVGGANHVNRSATVKFEGQVRNLIRNLTHPHCRLDTVVYEYDFGLFFTSRPFVLNATLQLVTLPWNARGTGREELQEMLNAKYTCTAVGWGITEESIENNQTSYSWNLKVIDLQLMDTEECLLRLCRLLPHYCKYILRNRVHFCALSQTTDDVCTGDNGGPLTCDGVLHGVIALGPFCGGNPTPSLFSSVATAMEWIDSVRLMNETINFATTTTTTESSNLEVYYDDDTVSEHSKGSKVEVAFRHIILLLFIE